MAQTIQDTETAAEAQQRAQDAIPEALLGLQAFHQQFLAIADGFDSGQDQEAWQALNELLPHLSQLGMFCSAVCEDWPAAQPCLVPVVQTLEESFQNILNAMEVGDLVALTDSIRFHLLPLLEQSASLFERLQTGDVCQVSQIQLPVPSTAVTTHEPAAIFARNMQALDKHLSVPTHQNITDYLETFTGQFSSDEPDYAVFSTSTEDGRRVLLHSQVDPSAEAMRVASAWAAQQEVNWENIVVVLGAGAFYHLEAMQPSLCPKSLIILIDTDVKGLVHALHARDLSHLTDGTGSFIVIVDEDEEVISRQFYEIVRLRDSIEVGIVSLPAWQRARPAQYERLLQQCFKQATAECYNRCTIARFADEWLQHAMVNLPDMACVPGADALQGAFRDKPAFVVAAGPSLNDTISLVKEHQDQAVIIAVGTALRPLIRAGIRPQIAVQVDSDPVTMKQFLDLDLSDIYLVSVISAFPEVVRKFDDRIFGFSETLEECNEWLASFDCCQGHISIGGTVTLSAIDLAFHFRCDPVFVFGLDLSLKEDGTSHVGNSMYQGNKYPIEAHIPGNFKETVPATRQWASYVRIFDNYMSIVKKRTEATIYNVNTGGARIQHIPAILPTEAETLISGDDLHALDVVRRIHQDADRPSAERVCKELQKAMTDVRKVKRIANEAVRHCSKAESKTSNNSQKSRERQAKAFDKLKECDEKLKGCTVGLQLVNAAVKSACMHLQSINMTHATDDQILAHSRTLYQQIAGGADWLLGFMDSALKSLKSKKPKANGDS